MSKQESRPAGATAGGGRSSAGATSSRTHYTKCDASCKAPDKMSPAYLKHGMIWCEGRHLASVGGGVLRRSFDPTRELLRGGLAFRRDVLEVARQAGCSCIEARDRLSGQVYRVALEAFERHAWPYDHKSFGAQLCLPLTLFDRQRDPGEPLQLALLEEVGA